MLSGGGAVAVAAAFLPGLAPLAFGLGKAGYEIEAPMAITVLGGLATSTVLNLLVLMALAERAGGARGNGRVVEIAG